MPKIIYGKPVDEEKWAEAKRLAAEEGHDEDYDYIVTIYKRLAHLGKAENGIDRILEKKYTKGRIKLTLAKRNYFTTEVRCVRCDALLYKIRPLQKGVFTEIEVEIRCRKCGTYNII